MAERLCKNCKYYNQSENECSFDGEQVSGYDGCANWVYADIDYKEELEAQKTDAAERETHRQEVEGDIDEG